MPRERGAGRAGEGDDPDGKALEGRQQVEQFLRLTRVAQRQDHVAVADDAQVAVQRVHAVQHDAGCAGAREGGGDFVADVTGLADANHHNFAALPEPGDDQLHRAVKRSIELRANRLQPGKLDVENLTGSFQVSHARRGCQRKRRHSTWKQGKLAARIQKASAVTPRSDTTRAL